MKKSCQENNGIKQICVNSWVLVSTLCDFGTKWGRVPIMCGLPLQLENGEPTPFWVKCRCQTRQFFSILSGKSGIIGKCEKRLIKGKPCAWSAAFCHCLNSNWFSYNIHRLKSGEKVQILHRQTLSKWTSCLFIFWFWKTKMLNIFKKKYRVL